MALEEMEKENYVAAKEILIRAQRESEGLYILVDDWLRENEKKGTKTAKLPDRTRG